MLHVLLDGDNIQYDTFVSHIKDNVDLRFGSNYIPDVFCQTNIIIKHSSLKTANIRIHCSKTTNKNASDARILVHIGKLLSTSNDCIIVIVSNDKIFEEIADNQRIFLIGYVSSQKRVRLKKTFVLQAMKTLDEQRKLESDNIYLADLYEYLNYTSISILKDYINKFVPEIYIASNDVIYLI
uniref:NYN domain-containing protein n=1 Tax=viral metagenome TaxID=1070528 RepID=A0A6C0F7E2_9ZZZZ|tara:strand:+ start:12076 stop:12621 length:546 start_codon:yes stop_codon:yes gene_type:complete